MSAGAPGRSSVASLEVLPMLGSRSYRSPLRRQGGLRPLTLIGLTVAAVVAGMLSAPTAQAAATVAAGDGPGALSHFDLARKDCLGTSRTPASKVWFTVANGVLSDTYYPTIDNTNVETLQFVVTDGQSFTDLQTRDTTYTVLALDRTGMSCEVTSTAKNGRYTIVTDYFTDPSQNSVVINARLKPTQPRDDLKLYVRLDPTINGNGGGGSGNGGADDALIDTSTGSPVPVARDEETATNAANRDYAQPVYAALRADLPFLAASAGYVGAASDGLTQLDADHRLTSMFGSAPHGNIALTSLVDTSRGGRATLALGFGKTQSEAIAAAGATASTAPASIRARYAAG